MTTERTVKYGYVIDDIVRASEISEFDDGIQARSDGNGGYILEVSIVDATSISIGSSDDRQSADRIETDYARGISMLPKNSSISRLSFYKNRKRPAFTFSFPFDGEYSLIRGPGLSMELTLFTTVENLSYGTAEKVISNSKMKYHGDLFLCYLLARNLFRKGDQECELDPGIIGLEMQGGYNGSHRAHMLVNNAMVLVNISFASFCTEHGIPAIYRKYRQGDAYAYYCAEPTIHDGVGSFYAQITSPLRRRSDLMNCRNLDSYFKGVEFPHGQHEIEEFVLRANRKAEDDRAFSASNSWTKGSSPLKVSFASLLNR